MKKALALGLILAAFMLFEPAVAQQHTPVPGLIAQGALLYGTVATFAPYCYQVGDKLVGFDIDLAAEIGKELGIKAEPLAMEFKGLIPALQAGRIDAIIAGLYMNEERAKQVDFIPYIKVGNELLVKKGNPKKIHGRNDLCGTAIAVTLGGFQEKYAREDAKRCADGNRAAVTVLTFPSAQDSVLAVQSGRADALYNSTPGAIKLITELPDQFEIAGATIGSDTRLGIAVRKDQPALKQALERALQKVVADGRYMSLIQKYKMTKDVSVF